MARRNLFSSYFSRESLRRAEPHIQKFTSKFLGILQAAISEDEGKTVNLSMGFRCLTSDVIMNFSFNKPLGALDSGDFEFPLTRALKEAVAIGQWSMYFPSSFRILFQWIDNLPLWFLDKYMEPLALTKWCMKVNNLRSIILIPSRMTLQIQGCPRTYTRIESSIYLIFKPPTYNFRYCTQPGCGERTSESYYR